MQKINPKMKTTIHKTKLLNRCNLIRNTMKKILIFLLLLLVQFSSFSQKLDLIVTTSGDSVACKIDSITDSKIYFQVKAIKNQWAPTMQDIEKIVEYKYDCIDPSEYTFIKGTTIITGTTVQNKIYPKKFPDKSSLEKASIDELNFYLAKAKKTRKTGAILSIAGPLTFATGVVMAGVGFSGGPEYLWGSGVILIFAGTGFTLVGLPVLITGSSRVNRIKNTLSDRAFIEIAPCSFHNHMAQNNQNGVSLRIRF